MNTTDNTINETLQEILNSDVKLPALPGTGLRLLEITQKSINDIDVGKLSRLIEADPTLYARVLHLANSAYYGTINTITDVRQAIMHIGLEETLYSIQWLFFQNMLPTFPAMDGFNAKGYWDHAWACGVANKKLGQLDLTVKVSPGELYLAGLFHGIGKLILALHQPDKFQQCLNNSRDYSLPLAESEQDIFGITDTFIASQVMQSWSIPANICAAVQFYNSPADAKPEYENITSLTQFAYYIANTSGIGNSGDEFCFDFKDTYIAKNWDSLLTEDYSQMEIVQDIHSALREKVLAVTGEDAKTASPEPVAEKLANIDTSIQSTSSRKKTFWHWLRSLWKSFN